MPEPTAMVINKKRLGANQAQDQECGSHEAKRSRYPKKLPSPRQNRNSGDGDRDLKQSDCVSKSLMALEMMSLLLLPLLCLHLELALLLLIGRDLFIDRGFSRGFNLSGNAGRSVRDRLQDFPAGFQDRGLD